MEAELITAEEWEAAVSAMAEAGKQAGKAAGSWVADGNTSESALREIVRMWEERDREAPSPPNPLSGEWADDPSLTDIIGRETDIDPESLTPEKESDLADAYEDAYFSAWQEEAERTVKGFLPD